MWGCIFFFYNNVSIIHLHKCFATIVLCGRLRLIVCHLNLLFFATIHSLSHKIIVAKCVVLTLLIVSSIIFLYVILASVTSSNFDKLMKIFHKANHKRHTCLVAKPHRPNYLIFEKCYIRNIFTTNFKWKIITG